MLGDKNRGCLKSLINYLSSSIQKFQNGLINIKSLNYSFARLGSELEQSNSQTFACPPLHHSSSQAS